MGGLKQYVNRKFLHLPVCVKELLVAGAHDARLADAPLLVHLGAQLVGIEGILKPPRLAAGGRGVVAGGQIL